MSILKVHKFKWLFVFIILRCLLIVPVSFGYTGSSWHAQTIENKATIQGGEDLFKLIAKLEKSVPFRSKAIAKLIERPFLIAPEFKYLNEPNTHIRTTKDTKRLISQVWAREPAQATDRDKGGLGLVINPNMHCITHAEILKRFGKESSIDEQPINQASFDCLVLNYNYKRPWGTLIFQFLRKEPHYLLYIIFETCHPCPCDGVLDESSQKLT